MEDTAAEEASHPRPEEINETDPNDQETEEVTTDKDAIFASMINRVNEEDTAERWLLSLCRKINSRFHRMPRGWWGKIRQEFNNKFDLTNSLNEVKSQYNRAKSQISREAAAGRSDQDEAGEQPLPSTIFNVKLYTKVKNSLLSNVDKVLNQQTERTWTRKVFSQETRYDVLELMNTVIRRESLDQKANNLMTLNDLFYACQLTYDEVTKRPKKEVNWRESIEKKIAKFEKQLEVVMSHNPNEAPTLTLIQLCKNNLIHSNNQNQLQQLKDELEEKRAVYAKKIVMADKRAAFRKENKLFECNRSTFYRELKGEKGSFDPEIDKAEVQSFWLDMWSAGEEEQVGYQELIDLVEPVQLSTDFGTERIKSITANRIKYLPNWKAPGPDYVYGFFIKRMYALHERLAQLVSEAIEDPELIDDKMYVGNTYLAPKVVKAKRGNELRPITCLPNLYKLTSKVVTDLVTDLCTVNEVVSENQMGTRRDCQGAKEQALLNKALNDSLTTRSTTTGCLLRGSM